VNSWQRPSSTNPRNIRRLWGGMWTACLRKRKPARKFVGNVSTPDTQIGRCRVGALDQYAALSGRCGCNNSWRRVMRWKDFLFQPTGIKPADDHCPYCGAVHMTHGQFVKCCGDHGGYDAPPETETDRDKFRQALGEMEQ